MFAAFILVALKGWLTRQEKEMQQGGKSKVRFKVLNITTHHLEGLVCLTLPYLLEVHYDATFLHHGVLLVVIHQVGQGVEPLTSTHIVFTVLLNKT